MAKKRLSFARRVEVRSTEGNLLRRTHAEHAQSLMAQGAFRHPLDTGEVIRVIVFSHSISRMRRWPKLPVKPNNQLKESKAHQLSNQPIRPVRTINFTPVEIHSHVFNGSKYGSTNRVVA